MSSTYDFCNFAEKYNEKMNMWDEVMLAIKTNQLYFYDKNTTSPKHFTDRTKPKLTTYNLDHCQSKTFEEYQINKQIKQNVILLHIHNITLIFSFKNEMQMQICSETIKSHSSKSNHSLISNRTMKAVQNKVLANIRKAQSKDSLGKLSKNQSTNCLISRPQIDQMKKAVKEENKPLTSLINDLLQSSSSYSSHQDSSSNTAFKVNEEQGNINKAALNKKKNQLNQIIQLSCKTTSDELLSSSISLISSPKYNRGQLEHFKPLQYDLDGSVDEGLVNNSFFNTSNKNKDNQSFSFPQQLLSASSSEKIQNIINRIENYEIYIYDSYIIKKLIKDNSLTKEDFGTIYSLLNNDCLKSRILIEMIALCSKRRLTKLIHQKTADEKVEVLIIEVFNTFLGNNNERTDLYDKILPGELNDIFKIDILLDISRRISFPNLFVVMEYKNKIYFNDNLDINFSNPLPFVDQDIKYISPYLILKWTKHAISPQAKTAGVTMTNIKRMPINPQLSHDHQLNEMNSFKEYESMNDETRLVLVMDIYQLIYQKKYELSLKLCDYYVQKFTDSIFLNPIVYLILLEIYNQTIGIDLAKLFFEKCCSILNWLYPNDSCYLIVDVYYTYSLMLMKQSENYVYSNLQYVLDVITRTKDLSERFYANTNEKYIKIKLQYHLFNYLHKKSMLPIDEIVSLIFSLPPTEGPIKEIYLQLFIDCLEGDLDNRIAKLNLIQALNSFRNV